MTAWAWICLFVGSGFCVPNFTKTQPHFSFLTYALVTLQEAFETVNLTIPRCIYGLYTIVMANLKRV